MDCKHLKVIIACGSQQVGLTEIPTIFCQCIDDYALLLSDKESSQRKSSVLTCKETFGLHYVAGYIPRSLRKNGLYQFTFHDFQL